MPEPDLTRELDAAEAIVMGGATVKTQWASRDEAGIVFVYGADAVVLSEEVARSAVRSRARRGCRDVLGHRTVTYGPWVWEEAAENDSPSVAVTGED